MHALRAAPYSVLAGLEASNGVRASAVVLQGQCFRARFCSRRALASPEPLSPSPHHALQIVTARCINCL